MEVDFKLKDEFDFGREALTASIILWINSNIHIADVNLKTSKKAIPLLKYVTFALLWMDVNVSEEFTNAIILQLQVIITSCGFH